LQSGAAKAALQARSSAAAAKIAFLIIIVVTAKTGQLGRGCGHRVRFTARVIPLALPSFTSP
jgi:hypothetical protein